MDYTRISFHARDRVNELQSSSRQIDPIQLPSAIRKSLAQQLYTWASRLEPKAYPPRRLARK